MKVTIAMYKSASLISREKNNLLSVNVVFIVNNTFEPFSRDSFGECFEMPIVISATDRQLTLVILESVVQPYICIG
jgi:hypothetical protein